MKFLNNSTSFKKITLFLLITLNYCSGNVVNNKAEKPEITFEWHSTAKWRNITFPEEFSGPGVYSEKGETLYASCSAAYPIKWEFTGLINPISVLKIREPQRAFNPDKFTIKLAAFFITARNEPSLAASLRIRCEDLESFTKSEFSMYVKGNRNETLLSSKSKEIVDPWFIPCPTTTPLEPVHLFKLGSEAVKVEGVVYDPWRGFRQNDFGFFEEGAYLCRQGSSEVKFTVEVSHPKDLYNPSMEEKLTIPEAGMFLLCSSNNKDDVMEFRFEGDAATKLYIGLVEAARWAKAIHITHKEKIFKGKVSCLKNKMTLKEWNFEFVEVPEIHFDDYFSEMLCLTEFEEMDGVEVEAKSLRCSNGIDCSYYERCLEEGKEVCDHLGQAIHSNKRRTRCDPMNDSFGISCVNLYYTSWNGIAQCKVEGFKRSWQYFTALNFHKYTDWREVNENDLLRLEREEGNGFRCTGVGFLFANSLSFELKYEDNSTEFIQGKGKNGEVIIHEHTSPYKIQGFQVVSSLELITLENVKSVRCVAPFWNSTEVIKTPFYKL